MLNRLLFVDDEPNILASYRRHFGMLYYVDTAVSGAEALEKMKDRDQYSVIVTDYMMPGMDGLEFAAEAKKISNETVLIINTGGPDFDIAMRAVNEGNIFRFLVKPMSYEKMHPIIKQGIKQFKLNKTISNKLVNSRFLKELTMCTECYKVKIPDADHKKSSSWQPLEVYFGKHYALEFSHGLCPECTVEHYGIVHKKKSK